MLSSTEVKQLKFEKAVFGGYDMQAVDTAFSQLSGDYEKLEQQNTELRSKMKILVDKIEEYRRVEEGIRQALLTAQNIAEETMDKANREAERILNEANEQADRITSTAERKGSLLLRQYEESLVQEKNMLREAQHESAYFIEMMTRRFREESERIAAIPTSYGFQNKLEEEESSAETITGSVEAPVEPVCDEPEETDDFIKTFSTPLIPQDKAKKEAEVAEETEAVEAEEEENVEEAVKEDTFTVEVTGSEG